MSQEMRDPWGYINGKPVYSRDEWIFTRRGFGAIETDEELLEFARKKSGNWYHAGWHRTFETYFLSDYVYEEPYASLTKAEFNRLIEMQRKSIEKKRLEEDAREWKLWETRYYADNSVEEIWKDKDGIEKTVMVKQPSGDSF